MASFGARLPPVMIDIHHHCLPGIDDGPRDLRAAVELCRRASDEGITDIIATPHVLRPPWINKDPAALDTLRELLQSELGSSPRIHKGCEYFLSHDVLEQLQSGAIVPLAGSRYVLVEFASTSIPPMVERLFYEIGVRGYVPVIAHPERNLVFQEKPELLKRLVSKGTRAQLTAGSLGGHFGRKAERAARNWLQRELVHFVATDSHSLEKRPPYAREAENIITEEVGSTRAEELLRKNPAAVLGNSSLPYDPDPYREVPDHGLLKRITRFFGS